MANGFMEKMLWVDLSARRITTEPLDKKIGRDFFGGYGLGARILFSRQEAGIDPLGPEAIIGFVTGVLTGTDALGGTRYVVVGKSPLTGSWGDANSGGNVGPYIKFTGYDALFFTGISEKPVYLFIDNGNAKLMNASDIWGMDSFETQDILRERHGKDVEVSCIGQAGEKFSLISAVMNNKGRAAGRSGLGAVMGSKRLKAIALKGALEVPVADAMEAKEMRKRHLAKMGPRADFIREFGTSGLFGFACETDDSPCKNWSGTVVVDFPQFAVLNGPKVIEKQERRYGCWRCPIACGGIMKENKGEYPYGADAHKPEYETLAMFGSNLLNDNLSSIIKLNDICNRYGLDTISAGAAIAFTIECYEDGILSRDDTDGLEMIWGNHKSIVAMTEKLGRREGFGDIIADGVKRAAEKIGSGSEKYAMHIAGQEVPAHDSRGDIAFAMGYGASPTPGRHTQSGEGPLPDGALPEYDRASFKGRGEIHQMGVALTNCYNAAGICMMVLGDAYRHFDYFIESLNAITGWGVTKDELIRTGERIETMRQAFNVREGLRAPWKIPDRLMGIPPKKEGPRAGITLNADDHFKEYFQAMDWDPASGKPSKKRLIELGLGDVAESLWP
jgi:aldehyde:ferredoxin oxidoreductase